ncbi:hypothetical protein [Agromyces sp. SYSU T00194]|uniref:hypothetical protein n=1 Tax=Agromyces chitinivorans TaxID=3158560 RepID=UPI00339AE564
MRFGLTQSAALVMIAGSVLFLVAAFLPISARVYPRPPAERLEAITAAPVAWTTSLVLFGAGALVTALGVVLLALDAGGGLAGGLAWAAALVLLAGIVPWAIELVQRASDPAGFADGLLPRWTFPAYAVLTLAGIVLLGIVLLVGSYPAWAGWVVLGWVGALIVLVLAIADLPPFLFYVATVFIGVVLLVPGRE